MSSSLETLDRLGMSSSLGRSGSLCRSGSLGRSGNLEGSLCVYMKLKENNKFEKFSFINFTV